jgi:uncharacterized membrane protein
MVIFGSVILWYSSGWKILYFAGLEVTGNFDALRID